MEEGVWAVYACECELVDRERRDVDPGSIDFWAVLAV